VWSPGSGFVGGLALVSVAGQQLIDSGTGNPVGLDHLGNGSLLDGDGR
jgi:hypothetical protein